MDTLTRSTVALLVLTALPVFGQGGQAQAGFAQSSVSRVENTSPAAWGSLLVGYLRGDEPLSQATQTLAAGGSAPSAPSPSPAAPFYETENANTTGAGSGAAPSGASGPSPAGLVRRPELPPPTQAGLLFLAETPYRPQALDERWFRPPRGCRSEIISGGHPVPPVQHNLEACLLPA